MVAKDDRRKGKARDENGNGKGKAGQELETRNPVIQ